MNIYLSHSTNFNYKNNLYLPIQNSELSKKYSWIFPHAQNELPYDTKDLFQKMECDKVLAEVSYSSTGQGIELGWADLLGLRITCIYKKGYNYSSSLKIVAKEFLAYEDNTDLINKLLTIL